MNSLCTAHVACKAAGAHAEGAGGAVKYKECVRGDFGGRSGENVHFEVAILKGLVENSVGFLNSLLSVCLPSSAGPRPEVSRN